MAKIQPLPASSISSSFPSSADECQQISPTTLQKQQAVYTVWMKSLVFNGNGCTVYGADGGVAYRVDNYGCKGGREVFFMDRAGNTLLTIRRRGFLFGMFKSWEAFRSTDVVDGSSEEEAAGTTTPWFRVQKTNNGAAVVKMMHGSGRRRACSYRIDGCSRKSDYRIIGGGGETDGDAAVAATIARKQTASGVVLGEDVLTLTVGSEADHLLVLGLVVVCGLMNRRL